MIDETKVAFEIKQLEIESRLTELREDLATLNRNRKSFLDEIYDLEESMNDILSDIEILKEKQND